MKSKKRILVIEALHNNRGNKKMAMRTIECLAEVCDVTVAMLPGWFSVLPETVKVEEYNIADYYKIPQVNSLIRSIRNLEEARELDRKNHYDYIIFLSYHTVAFCLAMMWFRKFSARIIITHHVNIDDLAKSKIKDFFFKRYARKVNHFVFEPFIKDFLVERYKVKENKVFVLPHPQNKYEYKERGEQYDCLGISNSNDEALIQQIIEVEKDRHIFKNNYISILLRSKQYEFDDGFLKVINTRFDDDGFDDDEYYQLYTSALIIVLLFPSTFKYRMSGSIIDALSNRKIVLLSDIPLFREYANRYPDVCKIGVEPERIVEFIKQLKNGKGTTPQTDDWERFSEDHSNERIINLFCEMFEIKEH